ncbi:hypothetical protein ACFXJ5_34325 [Streptomyces sp. NPDC059373]
MKAGTTVRGRAGPELGPLVYCLERAEGVRPLRSVGEPVELSAFPYFAWANGGPCAMRVWVRM